MPISEQMIDQAYSDLKPHCGGIRNDYFGSVYLEKEMKVERDKAINQVAFGGNDYGIDGFHFDELKHNLYIYQFKFSKSHGLFKDSFKRLIDTGVQMLFAAESQDQNKNQILLQLKSCIIENRSIIEQVYFRFVFTGESDAADKSLVLDKLREDLESKKHLLDEFFGKQITMLIDFRSTSGRVGSSVYSKKTHEYPIDLAETLVRNGPNGEEMYIGFIRLIDLSKMFREMGQRFFERNIRGALPQEGYVNRSLNKVFNKIGLSTSLQ